MGRWAQNRRRGGGPPPPPPTPPPPTNVDNVAVDLMGAQTLRWQFDTAVNLVGATVPGLEADDGTGFAGPASCVLDGPNAIRATYAGLPFVPGGDWRLLADPSPDLTSDGGFSVPESGATL